VVPLTAAVCFLLGSSGCVLLGPGASNDKKDVSLVGHPSARWTLLPVRMWTRRGGCVSRLTMMATGPCPGSPAGFRGEYFAVSSLSPETPGQLDLEGSHMRIHGAVCDYASTTELCPKVVAP
jgi:hypothetical protein